MKQGTMKRRVYGSFGTSAEVLKFAAANGYRNPKDAKRLGEFIWELTCDDEAHLGGYSEEFAKAHAR